MISLRPYQREAVDAIFRWFTERNGHGLVVLPTASGKSVVQAFFLKEAIERYPSERFMLVSHIREILQQNADKLHAVWPGAPIGIYSAGLDRRETQQQITVAGIQSVCRRADLFGDIGVCIIDEAHLVPRIDGGMYRTFIDGLRQANPSLKIIGMSATPYRLDSGALHEGADALFDGIAYEASIDRLVKDGYLCRLVSRLAAERADLRGLHVRGGEYIESELDLLLNTNVHIEAAIDETLRLCANRNKWLVFCCSVDHAERVTAALQAKGVSARCITGETSLADRDGALADFQAGITRALCSVNVLSTGFDAPDVDAIIMLRPTLSTGLYVQQCGRGMRLHPSKENCLLLDFAGNILQHGPINDVSINAQRKGGGTPRFKECPACHEPIPTGCNVCPECSYVFPKRPIGCGKPPHDDHASPLEPMSDTYADEVVEDLGYGMLKTSVRYVVYNPHQSKPFKPSTMQVIYHCSRREHFKEWICFDHPEGSFPRRKAESWWKARSDTPVPATVDEAVTMAPALKRPRMIVVNTNEEYPRIVSHLELEEPTIDLEPVSQDEKLWAAHMQDAEDGLA